MKHAAALFLSTLVLAARASVKIPVCEGVLEELVVDFETDASGNPLSPGDVPTRFPGGLTIAKVERNERARFKTTKRDHVIFDSGNPVREPDLFSETEGNVLIINRFNDPSKQNDERLGGLVRFKITKAVFQVNSIRFLSIESSNPNRTPDTVSGRSKRSRFRRFTPTEVPPGGNKKPTTVYLENFFFPKRLDINLQGSGAIAAINLSICDKGRNRTLTEDAFLPSPNTDNDRTLTEDSALPTSNTENEPRKLQEDIDSDKTSRPFFRVDEEAVDFKLEWSSTDAPTGEGEEEFLINPSFVFVRSGEDGGTNSDMKWVRAARRHSMAHDIWEDSSYQNRNDIREELLTYYSDIVLSTVPFSGNLSAGFTDAEIASWGLQEPSDDFSADSLTLRSGLAGDLRDSLCEPKPIYGPEEGALVRKQTTGPEDPKLFVLSNKSDAEDDAKETIGLAFSSYPPSDGLSEWDDKCVFRMYTSVMSFNSTHAIGGMEATPKELKCGESLSDEKNWIAFQYKNALHYVYSIEPHVVVKVDDDEGSCHLAYNTSSPYLESLSTQVSLRGSATAVRYDESSFIALIHTYDGHSVEPYQTLVYKFASQPPFRVLAVSRPLELQSAGLSFASSIVTVEDKVMVGYGVHDRSSRLMVMSRRYLDRQFMTDDCDEAMQTKVEATGNSCGQEALSLMIGSQLMTPRRAMNQIADTMSECRLLSGSRCSPNTILNKVRLSQHHVTSCAMALHEIAGGEPCNARVKWLVTEENIEARKAMRIVAEQYEECQPLMDLNCGPEDLHWPNGKLTVCDAYIHNDYKKGGPGVLLSIGRAGSGLLRPLLQCVGISTETHKCEGSKELSFVADETRVKQCLEHGQYHFVKLHPYVGGVPAQKSIEKVSRLAASLGNRTAEERPKVVTMVRDPLRVVFAWLEAEFGGLTAPSSSLIRNFQTRIDRYEFAQLSSTMEGHQFILESIRRNCRDNVKDWDLIKSIILDPAYDTLMVTGEELRSRTIRPALLASLSNHILGKPSSSETIFKGIQTIDSVYSSKVDAKGINLMSFTDFYIHSSPEGMPYICHLIQEAPEMVRAIAEQNYKAEFAKLAAYCPGFDEAWLDDMAEPIFVGLTEHK